MKITKNQKKINTFTSLRMNRVAEEEIIKYNNNAIHYTHSSMENKNLIKNKYNTANKYSNSPNDKNYIQNTTSQTKYKTINNILNTYEYKINPKNQKNKNSIDKIVINLYSRKTEKDEETSNEDNKINDENKSDNDEYENLINNNNSNIINENDAIKIVQNRWIQNNKVNKINLEFLGKKRNINKNNNKIITENNFNFIKKINNKINIWENKIQKETLNYFSLYKDIQFDEFIYSEKNYIKDIIKTITIPKNKNFNNLFIVSHPDKHHQLNKINYKLINPKNKTELESELYNYYIENKNENNYFSNIDNNDNMEEQKIKPIYILTEDQIFQLYNEIKKDNDKEKNNSIGINVNISDDLNNKNKNIDIDINNNLNNLLLSKQDDLDYE